MTIIGDPERFSVRPAEADAARQYRKIADLQRAYVAKPDHVAWDPPADLGYFNCRGDYVVDGVTYATDTEGNITGRRTEITQDELDEIVATYRGGRSGRFVGLAGPPPRRSFWSEVKDGLALFGLAVVGVAFLTVCGAAMLALLVMLNPL